MGSDLTKDQQHRLATWVSGNLGLSYPPERQADLARAFLRYAESKGEAPERLVEKLLDGAAYGEQLADLAPYLTVGETYFFREPATFQLLSAEILPALLQGRDLKQPTVLNIWSAGCCTGEEAYSLAIFVGHWLSALGAAAKVSVLGTDINQEFLEKARRAVYKSHSFRTRLAELACYEPYFERDGDSFRVRADIAGLVRFAIFNLAGEQELPSCDSPSAGFDLIICRNVLIYFSAEKQIAALKKLAARLAPGGYICLAPCEIPANLESDLPELERVEVGGRFFLRSVPAEKAGAAGSAGLTGSLETSFQALTLRYHLYVNTGRFQEAIACLNQYLASTEDSRALYLRALVEEQTGAVGEAEASFLRCLEQQPDFHMARFLLASGYLARGKRPQGVELLQHLRITLAQVERDSLLPFSEGITASALLSVIDSLLQ